MFIFPFLFTFIFSDLVTAVCEKDRDCDNDEICHEGICREICPNNRDCRSDTSNPIARTNEECCDDGLVCNIYEMRCVKRFDPKECPAERQCTLPNSNDIPTCCQEGHRCAPSPREGCEKLGCHEDDELCNIGTIDDPVHTCCVAPQKCVERDDTHECEIPADDGGDA